MRSIRCALAALALTLAVACAPKEQALPASAVYDGILRLHVIANSDSPEDQAVKYRVRDAVLETERGMANAASSDEAEEMLTASGGELIAAIEDTLSSNGMDYGAQLRLGQYDFPEKNYAGKVYPAGEYRALRVVLGEGAGQNWWCVMFPPLCVIELDGESVQTPVKFDSLILKHIREGKSDK